MTAQITILVVDDEDLIQRVVRRVLRANGFEEDQIVKAMSPTEALGLVDKTKEDGSPFSLILTDQRMPSMENAAKEDPAAGPNFIRLLRERGDETPAILMTAEPGTAAVATAIESRLVKALLTKPFVPDQLLAAIKKALEKE